MWAFFVTQCILSYHRHTSKVLRGYDTCYTRNHSVLPATKQEPYLPLLASHRASPPIGWNTFRVPLKIGGWVDLMFTYLIRLFHHRSRTAYLYNEWLAWYNVLITSRVHSSVKSQFQKVRQTKYTAADSCDGGISVLNHCLSWSKFVNTHLHTHNHFTPILWTPTTALTCAGRLRQLRGVGIQLTWPLARRLLADCCWLAGVPRVVDDLLLFTSVAGSLIVTRSRCLKRQHHSLIRFQSFLTIATTDVLQTANHHGNLLIALKLFNEKGMIMCHCIQLQNWRGVVALSITRFSRFSLM